MEQLTDAANLLMPISSADDNRLMETIHPADIDIVRRAKLTSVRIPLTPGFREFVVRSGMMYTHINTTAAPVRIMNGRSVTSIRFPSLAFGIDAGYQRNMYGDNLMHIAETFFKHQAAVMFDMLQDKRQHRPFYRYYKS